MPLLKDDKVQAKHLQKLPRVVIMGKTGAGKTTLCNILCGTKHETGSAQGSMTMKLYENPVNVGDFPFRIIDTPGTDSKVDTFKHAVLLKEALTHDSIHTIFMVIKYESRFDKITEAYDDLELPVKGYASNIVVIISQWDYSKTPEKDYQKICELFAEEYPNLSNIIFYSENDKPVEIAYSMYRCLSNMKEVKLVIKDDDLDLNFNIYEAKGRVYKDYKQYEKDIDKKRKEFGEFVESITHDNAAAAERDEILRLVIIEFTREIEQLGEAFLSKHGSSMVELDYYACSVQLRSFIIRTCREFTETVSQYISYSLFDVNDPRNLIKRCDKCGLIWYKTEGCDGVTQCGNNEFESYHDIREKSFSRFSLQRINGVLRWFKSEGESIELEGKPRTSDDKRKGCGASIVWAQLPPVEEETIKELFQVKTIEEARELIRSTKYSEMKKEFLSTVDFKRHE